MQYKTTITKSDGTILSNGGDSLRSLKTFARRNSIPGDKILIEEIRGYNAEGYYETNVLYNYVVEDWSTPSSSSSSR